MNRLRSVRRCVCCSVAFLALAVGLLSSAPLWADEDGGTNGTCPANYGPNNEYQGCKNAGAKCKVGTADGTCRNNVKGTDCTCRLPGDQDQ